MRCLVPSHGKMCVKVLVGGRIAINAINQFKAIPENDQVELSCCQRCRNLAPALSPDLASSS